MESRKFSSFHFGSSCYGGLFNFLSFEVSSFSFIYLFYLFFCSSVNTTTCLKTQTYLIFFYFLKFLLLKFLISLQNIHLWIYKISISLQKQITSKHNKIWKIYRYCKRLDWVKFQRVVLNMGFFFKLSCNKWTQIQRFFYTYYIVSSLSDEVQCRDDPSNTICHKGLVKTSQFWSQRRLRLEMKVAMTFF